MHEVPLVNAQDRDNDRDFAASQHVSHVRTQNELQNHYVQRAKKLAEPSVVLFSSAVQLAGSTAAPARLESQPEGATREDTGKNVSTARCHLGGRCCSNSLVASACALLQEVHRVTNAQLNMNVLFLHHHFSN
jgi:hypothetical protein